MPEARIIHYPSEQEISSGWDCVSDIPALLNFNSLVRSVNRKESNVYAIKTTRELSSWLDSCSWHFSEQRWKLNKKTRHSKERLLHNRLLFFGCEFYNQGKFRDTYFNYTARFTENVDKMPIHIDFITGNSRPSRIMDYLGLNKFPHLNKSDK